LFAFFSDTDRSDSVTRCVPLHEVSSAARVAYWAFKLLKVLKTAPPPPP
jgi:hypothetical protein